MMIKDNQYITSDKLQMVTMMYSQDPNFTYPFKDSFTERISNLWSSILIHYVKYIIISNYNSLGHAPFQQSL